jgi:ATP phosphoribosyltransferase regulatory subunit HisZ
LEPRITSERYAVRSFGPRLDTTALVVYGGQTSDRRRSAMSILNSILGQVSETATVQNLAAKVGLSPEQVEQAVAALGKAHFMESDTVTTAAEQTGLPTDKLNEIVGHIGGEGALGRFASMLQEDGAAGGMLGSISKMF